KVGRTISEAIFGSFRDKLADIAVWLRSEGVAEWIPGADKMSDHLWGWIRSYDESVHADQVASKTANIVRGVGKVLRGAQPEAAKAGKEVGDSWWQSLTSSLANTPIGDALKGMGVDLTNLQDFDLTEWFKVDPAAYNQTAQLFDDFSYLLPESVQEWQK